MAGEIEFFDPDPAPGEDEQLPEPPHRSLPGSPRGRRIAGIVVLVAVVVGALVVRASSSSTPVAAASTSAVPTTAPTIASVPSSVTLTLTPDTGRIATPGNTFCDAIAEGASVTVAPAAGAPGSGAPSNVTPSSPSSPLSGSPAGSSRSSQITCAAGNPQSCPEADDGQSACVTTTALPRQFLTAVRERFPGAVVRSATTEVTRATHLVWYRYVTLSAGDDQVAVAVEQSGNSLGLTGTRDDGSHLFTRAAAQIAGVDVIVALVSPSGSGRATAATPTGQLATDARVTTAS